MAIRNNTGAVAGLSYATSLEPADDFAFTCLAKYRQAHTSGEQPFFEIKNGGSFLELRANNLSGETWSFVLAATDTPSSWETLNSTGAPIGEWVALGISCVSGVLTIAHSTGSGEPVTTITRTFSGTWTPSALKVLHSQITWGSYMDVQNVKYGAAGLTAAQMIDECWSTSVVHTTVWTPSLDVDMTSGDLATQAGAFTLVSSGALVVAEGAITTSGTAPTITISSCTATGDDLAVAGTITTTGGATVLVSLYKNGEPAGGVAAVLSGLNWTANLTAVSPGTYVVRARVSDGGGAATDDDSATFIGLTGADEIPYTYPNTQIKAVPASASIPTGSTAVIKAVNQSGVAIPGAIVSSAAGSGTLIATAADLTDADGNVVVTGSAAGSANLVLSVVNLAGTTLSTTVPLTVTGASSSAVTVTPANVTMFINQTQQFTSVISGGGSTTWSVRSGLGSIDSNGLYTAPAVATTAVIRGAKASEPGIYDESTVTVSASTQLGIGAQFIGDGDISVAPGQSFSWQVKVMVNGQAYQGATIVPSSLPVDILDITTPLATSAAGTTTVTGSVVADTDTDIEVEVTLDITAGTLTMPLRATVTVQDSPYGYVIVRGRRYPRRFEQK